MLRTKLLRLQVNDERLRFTRGIAPENAAEEIEAWKCPKCFKKTGRAKILVSQVQFGFEWDSHVDYFRCKCGTHFYCPYRVWLIEKEVTA